MPLLWRRSAPLAAVGGAFAGLLLNDLLVGTEVIRCGVLLPTAFLLAFAIGAHLERRDALIGLGLTLALMAGDLAVEFGTEPFSLVFVAIAVAIWGIGRSVQSRRLMAEELEARTARLRGARDERTRLEATSDRARLSGELDELLQRRLGELARLADTRATRRRQPQRWSRSSKRAGGRWKRCVSWSASCATTPPALRLRPSRP